MGFLFKWFGIGKGNEIEKVPNKIHAQLQVIEELLNGTLIPSKTDIKKRTKLLKQAISNSKYSLEHEIQKRINQYSAMKKPDIKTVLFIQNLQRDLRTENLWQELLGLWNAERKAIDRNDDIAVHTTREEQRKIAQILEMITKQEFNETHMHFGMSVSPDVHWKYFKLLWAKAEKTPTIPDEANIKKSLAKYKREGKIFAKDAKAITKIMQKYFGGKISETTAFTQFEKILIMPEADKGCFHNFSRKANILNVMQDAARKTAALRWKFWYDCMDSIARHNLAHNITHIEIRYPAVGLEGLDFCAKVCKAIEQKYKGKITIRMIEFLLLIDTLDAFIAAYNTASKATHKYFVAVDPCRAVNCADMPSVSKYIKNCKFPVVVHAGEHWAKKDYPQLNASKRIKQSLQSVKTALAYPRLHRIGHANILGADITELLKGTKKSIVNALVAQQKALIREIKKRGIIIETNPTSNIMIRGITYEDHPIAVFDKQGIPYAISTDDRITFDTNLKKEFYRIARALKWTPQDIKRAAQMQRKALLR